MEKKQKIIIVVSLFLLVVTLSVSGLGIYYLTSSGETYFFSCRNMSYVGNDIQERYESGTYPVKNLGDFNRTERKLVDTAIQRSNESNFSDPPEHILINKTVYNSVEEPFVIETSSKVLYCRAWEYQGA